MSILVEVAEKAHVSVEAVLRVLTREPVSDAIKERVLAVLDDLDPEQNRILQRFALAALHDALPRPGESDDAVDDEPAEARALLPASESSPQIPAAAPDTAHLVQLSSVLEELAAAVGDLRRETDTERRERVDDLAVLIELISTGWQGLDRRLGRLERQLGRLETARAQPATVAPRRELPAQAPTAATPPPDPPAVPPTPAQNARGKRDRLPLAAAMALVGLVIGTLAVLQLVGGEEKVVDVSTRGSDFLETVADEPATTEAAATTTTAARTTTPARTTPARTRPPAPPTTSAVLGTTTPARPPAAPAATTTAEAEPQGFRPTRDWAWAPVDGADFYSVQFLRGSTNVYRTTTEAARLTLPDSVVFRPGAYRWIVRPGFGARSASRLGAPIVDSAFTVQ